MGRGIPDRWENYSNMGRQIPGTRFIAFKVPLKPELLRNLPPSVDPFGPRELMDHCSALGLVIDLTNTDRYYDSKVFASQNIQHEKVKTEGHIIPANFVIKKFFKVVETFLEKNACNDKLIGVHCTHGVNRTGYLICRYLIQQLGVPPDQAISDFNSARGHLLERENYLKNLRKTPWLKSGPSTPTEEGPGYRGQRSRGSYRFNNSSNRFNNSSDRFNTPSDRFNTPSNRFNTPSNRFNTPSDRFNTSSDRFGNSSDRYNNSSKVTPPYMPHQSRRFMRGSGGAYPQNEARLSRSPIGRPPSYGTSSSHGWGPHHSERLHGMAETWQPSTTSGSRSNHRNSSDLEKSNQEGTPEGEKFKSPVFGRIVYEQYYKGQVLPQYDPDFYTRGGGGVGPYRPHPKNIPRQQEGQRPRVYRGPRPYRTPPKLEEPFQDRQFSQRTPGTPYVWTSGRSPFSPSGTYDNVFSPENDGGRRRSNRFQPY